MGHELTDRLSLTLDDSDHVRIECPMCDAAFKVYERQNGKRVRCPSCTAGFVVDLGGDDPQAGKPRARAGYYSGAALVVLAIGGAAFAGGYQLGLQNGRQEAIQILEETRAAPERVGTVKKFE